MKIAIVGGGAAGFMAAITCAELYPMADVTIYERNGDVLDKVRISGGGRCNVTNSISDVNELLKNYPRGHKELKGAFSQFNTRHTWDWFEKRGLRLKTEADGRVFPTSDSSESVIEVLSEAVNDLGIQVKLKHNLTNLSFIEKTNGWMLEFDDLTVKADRLLIATGSSTRVWEMLRALGLEIEPTVPSLFTFRVDTPWVRALSGISLPDALVEIPNLKLKAEGPLLFTHWGFSGPAILKLSAWGAKQLNAEAYRFNLKINYLGKEYNPEVTRQEVLGYKQTYPKRLITTHSPFAQMPLRLWQNLCEQLEVPAIQWAQSTKEHDNKLINALHNSIFTVTGKSTFKDEFVTAGGIKLSEMDLKTFATKKYPTLFIAGEMLNIDAITGGFNFQAAWTGGYLAGISLGQSIQIKNNEN